MQPKAVANIEDLKAFFAEHRDRRAACYRCRRVTREVAEWQLVPTDVLKRLVLVCPGCLTRAEQGVIAA